MTYLMASHLHRPSSCMGQVLVVLAWYWFLLPPLVGSSCAPGFEEWENGKSESYCYQLHCEGSGLSKAGAEQYCHSINASLVFVTTKEENTFLRSILQRDITDAWMGMGVSGLQRVWFVGLETLQIGFTHFDEGHSKDTGVCAIMTKEGLWQNADCNALFCALCKYVDECSTGMSTCHKDLALCQDTISFHSCECISGYEGDGRLAGTSCQDVDECVEQNNECEVMSTTCTNTPGSYSCTCKSQFRRVSSTACAYCPDGWVEAIGGEVGSSEIKCYKFMPTPTDYSSAADLCRAQNSTTLYVESAMEQELIVKHLVVGDGVEGALWLGINKLHRKDWGWDIQSTRVFKYRNWAPGEEDAIVEDNKKCGTITVPSGKWVKVKCEDAEEVPLTYICKRNYDECVMLSSSISCHKDAASCINTPSSFKCECKEGFVGDGIDCMDIDECGPSRRQCGVKEGVQCVNLEGSFTCQCDQGYTEQRDDECSDVDECSGEVNKCSTSGGSCTNVPGSYTCACEEGYEGDGVTCDDKDECGESRCHEKAMCTNTVGSYQCACNTNYTGDGRVACHLDQCAAGVSDCDIEGGVCVNVGDGYLCECRTGFTGDGKTCSDEDECDAQRGSNMAPCHPKAWCNNTRGSYTCTCEAGMRGNGTSCEDHDECGVIEGKMCAGIEMTECVNTYGSYQCECMHGYVQKQTAVGCEDEDECVARPGPCLATATCSNVEGSYTCQCAEGTTGDGKTSCSDQLQGYLAAGRAAGGSWLEGKKNGEEAEKDFGVAFLRSIRIWLPLLLFLLVVASVLLVLFMIQRRRLRSQLVDHKKMLLRQRDTLKVQQFEMLKTQDTNQQPPQKSTEQNDNEFTEIEL